MSLQEQRCFFANVPDAVLARLDVAWKQVLRPDQALGACVEVHAEVAVRRQPLEPDLGKAAVAVLSLRQSVAAHVVAVDELCSLAGSVLLAGGTFFDYLAV